MSKATSFTGEVEAGTTRGVVIPDTLKRVGIYLGAALFIFLLGLGPMWLKARGAIAQRDAARRELRLSQTQVTLAAAAIDARRGEYETARQTASDFFTALRTELDAGEDSSLSARQREAAAPLLDRRDEIITLLARSDPASAERLSDLYVSYRAAVYDLLLK
ncbi:MAG: hypothetical protein LC795_04780 [Acidobacteria bacterium]|nr:hypothetical protein [Acidobacteriota bacterium]MCA1618620.1 hypothetical protein [Acidobacteriota bacterium]